ncbi:putative RNA-dependent RNA polymerase [Cryphonectria parasitica bipartite mycovirus 1]|uniref:putative RNA-dependent RNA polymerase n=1 Tax=Cryphonectria parasitica bipartite mycovirus 1 TaxID=1329781 RepID=UPI00032A4A12|nr:putative RNA-dependent RNA polymerase [Cryphonectria parasitica bipartite mycovirus 1]AGK89731.1 putative RNA-dependent RNA polymerase [Cryphonectria parasitica bipartite mycovirus 1]
MSLKRKASTISSDNGSLSIPSGSTSTRRRKNMRRVARTQEQLNSMNSLRQRFQHIQVLERVPAYAKPDDTLVTAPPDPLVVEFSKENPPPTGDIDFSSYTFVKACTPVEMAHLQNFDRPDHCPNDKYLPAIRQAADHVADLLQLKYKLFFPEKSALDPVRYYPGKFAGIEYAQIGLKTRKEADPLAQADAERAWDRLMRGERVQPHDVRLGGRGKVTKMVEKEGGLSAPAVGRLILMLSHRDLKLCGATEAPLTQSWSAPCFPIAVGQSWYHGGVKEFVDRFVPHERFYCFDARKFDSFINPWMVDLAVRICRLQFHDGLNQRYNAYWNFVRESLLAAPIYRDDGVRMQKRVGTTSGHSHNTLLQSIITLILGYAAIIILHPGLSSKDLEAYAWLESLGDDNVMGLSAPIADKTVEQIARVMWDAFQIDWSGKKSFATTRLLDATQGEFQGLQFLGKYFYLGDYPVGDGAMQQPIPYRPASETYLRLLYPEYGDLPTPQTYLRALGNYLDAAGNRAMEAWLTAFIEWLQPQLSYEPNEWPDNFKRMVSRDYSNVGVEVPRPRQIDFQQWRDLVVLGREAYRRLWRTAESQHM